MAAPIGHPKFDGRRRGRPCSGCDAGREERVVPGRHAERLGVDFSQKAERARTGVVVLCALKSVERSRRGVVELEERPSRGDSREIDPPGRLRESAGDRESLRPQRTKKRRHVDAPHPRLEIAGAGEQVIRRRDRGGRSHPILAPVLAEPLEQDVASQGRADGEERRARFAASERADDEIEIPGVARMIEARRAIFDSPRKPGGIARAGAEIQRGPVPTLRPRESEQTLGVDRERAPLEPVENEKPGPGAGTGIDVIEEDLVAVGRFQGLAAKHHEIPAPQERSARELEVGTLQPPRRRIVSFFHVTAILVPRDLIAE